MAELIVAILTLLTTVVVIYEPGKTHLDQRHAEQAVHVSYLDKP